MWTDIEDLLFSQVVKVCVWVVGIVVYLLIKELMACMAAPSVAMPRERGTKSSIQEEEVAAKITMVSKEDS